MKAVTLIFTVFMVANTLVSCGALLRWGQRQKGYETENPMTVFLDQHFDDNWMEHHYPNMKFSD